MKIQSTGGNVYETYCNRPGDEQDRAQLRSEKNLQSEIIEIGAVMLDENLQEIGNFRTYVKPEYNDKIAAEIPESDRDHRRDGSECTGIQGSIPDVHKLVPGNRR